MLWIMARKSKLLLMFLIAPLFLTGFSPSKSKCNPPKFLMCIKANLTSANLQGADFPGATMPDGTIHG